MWNLFFLFVLCESPCSLYMSLQSPFFKLPLPQKRKKFLEYFCFLHFMLVVSQTMEELGSFWSYQEVGRKIFFSFTSFLLLGCGCFCIYVPLFFTLTMCLFAVWFCLTQDIIWVSFVNLSCLVLSLFFLFHLFILLFHFHEAIFFFPIFTKMKQFWFHIHLSLLFKKHGVQ